MDQMRPMDRKREGTSHPLIRKIKRYAGMGLILVGVVAGVASIPVIFLWLFMPEPQEEASSGLAVAPIQEDVTFENGSIRLAGTLIRPEGPGPFPAMVVVHGSGRQTAESYAQLAWQMANEGFAVLTYDKRGVGRSTGTYETVGTSNSERTLGELAEDALAGVRLLKNREDIRSDRIGLAGVSQGGWIAPLAASRSDDVAFLLIYSGPTVTVGEEVFYSNLTGDDQGVRSELTDAEIADQLASYDGPRGFDPVPALSSLSIPGLWLLGERDRSIPIAETVDHLERLARTEGKSFDWEIFPNANHGLRNVQTGQRVEDFPVVLSWLDDVVLTR